MESWGEPVRVQDVWNFEGLGFDMVIFTLADAVEGELALGTTANLMKLHGGPHQVLIDKVDVLDGVSLPLL